MNILVLLSNWMDEDGNLNAESVDRAKCAIQKYNQCCDYILTLGWDCVEFSDINICDAFKEYICSQGVDTDSVLTESRSRDTVGDAIYSKDYLDRKFQEYEICIVTSDYHINRCAKVFRKIYGLNKKISFIASETNVSDYNHESKSLKIFYEMFNDIESGDLVSFEKRLLSHHPFYNGEIHNKINLTVKNGV